MDAVLFELGRRCCALELPAVEEAIPLGPVTPVPSAPSTIGGAINVRGQICPVLRLDSLLAPPGARAAARPPAEGETCLLVRAADCIVALSVDRILEVAHLEGARLISSAGPSGVVSAILETTRGMVQLIDAEQLVRTVARQLQGSR